MRKRLLALFITLLLMFSFVSLNVFAVNPNEEDKKASSSVQPQWSTFTTITCSLNFSGITGYVSAKANATSSTTQIEGTMTVYKKVLLFWVEVDKWTGIAYTNTINMSQTFTGESGKNYKLVFEATATYNGGYIESGSYEATATCP